MKNITYMLLVCFMILQSFSSNSSHASIIEFANTGGSNVKMVSSIFFNVYCIDGIYQTKGVGQIHTITQDNKLIWEKSVDNSIYYVFDNFEYSSIYTTPIFGLTYYGARDGNIDFYTSNSIINIGDSFTNDVNQIALNSKLFSGEASPYNGFTMSGVQGYFQNIGSTQFNVVDNSGLISENIVRDSIFGQNGETFDFSLNFSGDIFNSGKYDYSGSSDITMNAMDTSTVSVSEPDNIFLFALSIFIILSIIYKNKQTNK